MQPINIDDTYTAWREAALHALALGYAPDVIEWRVACDETSSAAQTLLDYTDMAPVPRTPQGTLHVRISRDLAAQLQDAALFRDPQRWAFLYKVLWRWHRGDRAAASPADEDGARLHRMAKAVRRAKHDMIAYVRFRRHGPDTDPPDSNATDAAAPEYIAWYEPAHDVLAWAADHFAQRMGRSTWLITTPHGAAWWNGRTLRIERRLALADDHRQGTADEAERLWLAYYRSTFNPARLNESVLEQHMPVRFWKGLPEGHLIPSLISEAKNGARRVAQARGVGAQGGKVVAVDAVRAQPLRDLPTSLDACRRCDLWRHATQAVAGAGPDNARLMLIGEQPGDHEDLAGKPFVGPAGQLLDVAMKRAHIARDAVYLTNAVKHFKWTLRGKRRLHKTPAQQEVEACGYWLEREWRRLRPNVVVTLGATALSALLRERVSLQDYVDAPFEVGEMWVVATYHPSFALRQQDDDARERVLNAISHALVRARELNEKVETAK